MRIAADRLRARITPKDQPSSKSKKDKKKSKWHMKRALKRIFAKIRNAIRDLHCKFSKFLCETYNLIIIPHFQAKEMVRRRRKNKQGKNFGRRIGKKTARCMMGLAHGKFRERLIHKSRMFPNCQVVVTREDYTSKTCSCCGNVQVIGSLEVFRCQNCPAVMDRDTNGAKGILIRFLTIPPPPIPEEGRGKKRRQSENSTETGLKRLRGGDKGNEQEVCEEKDLDLP